MTLARRQDEPGSKTRGSPEDESFVRQEAGAKETNLVYRHPYQVAIRGGSITASYELVDQLAQQLSSEYRVGQVRSSGGAGSEDQQELASGHAKVVATTERTVTSKTGEPDLFDRGYFLLDCDLVLSEGEAGDGSPVILLLDEAAPAPAIDPSRVIATVGASSDGWSAPHFRLDDVGGLAAALYSRLEAMASSVPLYGLVLAGGKSKRMGRPKWALEYHGEPQALALHRLLGNYCSSTFVSLRPEQAKEPALAQLPVIADRFQDMGPLGGILSAMSAHPDAAWLVLACDLPFVEASTLEELLAIREPLRFATSFVSPFDGMPEPLCAVYEPKARLRLFQTAALGYRCPRKMLMNSRTQLVECKNPQELTNANEPQEFERAVALLRAGGQR